MSQKRLGDKLPEAKKRARSESNSPGVTGLEFSTASPDADLEAVLNEAVNATEDVVRDATPQQAGAKPQTSLATHDGRTSVQPVAVAGPSGAPKHDVATKVDLSVAANDDKVIADIAAYMRRKNATIEQLNAKNDALKSLVRDLAKIIKGKKK